MRTRADLATAAAGSSIRYLAKPRLIGLSSGLISLRRRGVTPPRPSALAIRTAASAEASRSASSTRFTSPPVAARSSSIADSQASRTSGATSVEATSSITPIRRPEGSPATSSSPKSVEPSRRQSAASAQSGPETIIVVTAAMWWPSIAERPKVGFSPVRPQ